MDEALKRIGALTAAVASAGRRLSWNLARTTPDAIARTATARNEKLKAESEAYRRNRSDHSKVIAEIMKEENTARQLAASTARWFTEPLVLALDRAHTEFVAARRRDVSLSFDKALYGFDPVGMLQLAIYKEARRSALEHAGPDLLLRTYQRGLQGQDAAGFVDVSLIEERIETGEVLATKPGDLSVVRELRLAVAVAQDSRLPHDQLRDVEPTLAFARHAVTMADVAGVRPIAADQPGNVKAKEAFEAEHREYEQARAAAAGNE